MALRDFDVFDRSRGLGHDESAHCCSIDLAIGLSALLRDGPGFMGPRVVAQPGRSNHI